LAARAILWASQHDRRELNVSWSTVKAILANRLFPGVVDRYVARNGYSGQQSDELEVPRPDNLFRPVPGDPGAHGRFDSRAKRRSLYFWLTTNRAPIGWLGVIGLAAVMGLRASRLFEAAREPAQARS
jgi:hypothetical protein